MAGACRRVSVASAFPRSNLPSRQAFAGNALAPFFLSCLAARRTGKPVTSAMLALKTAHLELHSCALCIFWPGA